MFRKTVVVLPIFALILAFSSCSEIPENNDPVLGVWTKLEIVNAPEGKSSIREEWIFNDAYLGRYHKYQGQNLEIESDFGWRVEQSIYTIEYPGLERMADHVTITKEPRGHSSLVTTEGIPFANKE